MAIRQLIQKEFVSKIRHLSRDQEGQALVEFAVILPLFVLILVGILDLGQLFMTELTLQEAARDGARYASVGFADAQTEQEVLADAASLQTNNLLITISPSDGNRVSGGSVTVTVAYPFTFDPPLSLFLSHSLSLQATTTMRVE